MKVDTLLRPTKFNDIAAGTFFKVFRDGETFFGLAVIDADGDQAALVFAKVGNQPGVPWLWEGGITNDLVCAMPEAIIRPDEATAALSDGSPPFGALISTEQGFFIKASAGIGYRATLDIGTGATAKLSNSRRALVYSGWSVGRAIDGEFKADFNFPVPS